MSAALDKNTDRRFSLAVLSEVREVLERHGYPMDSSEVVCELQNALVGFLYPSTELAPDVQRDLLEELQLVRDFFANCGSLELVRGTDARRWAERISHVLSNAGVL